MKNLKYVTFMNGESSTIYQDLGNYTFFVVISHQYFLYTLIEKSLLNQISPQFLKDIVLEVGT